MFCKQSSNLWFHILHCKWSLKMNRNYHIGTPSPHSWTLLRCNWCRLLYFRLDRICCYCYNIFLEENDNPEVCGINAYFVVQHMYYLSKIWKLLAFDKVCQPQPHLAAAEFFSIKPHNIKVYIHCVKTSAFFSSFVIFFHFRTFMPAFFPISFTLFTSLQQPSCSALEL